MELCKVAELLWGLDSMNYGLLHCSFFGLSFEIFVFLQLSFFTAHIVLQDWVDPCFFSESSKENSLWVISEWGCSLWSFST